MSRTLRRRLHAFFLLAVFAGSGTGLPAVDELLYHTGRDSGPPPGTAHVDPPQGCGAHSEHCALTALTSVRPFAGLYQPVLLTKSVVCVDGLFHSVASLRSVDRSLLQPSRAPPVSAS